MLWTVDLGPGLQSAVNQSAQEDRSRNGCECALEGGERVCFCMILSVMLEGEPMQLEEE